MVSSQQFADMLHSVATALKVPVMAILLLMIAVTVLLIGTLIAEFFTERRHLKEKMPQLLDKLRAQEIPTAECIKKSKLLKRQKAALIELTKHPDLTNVMREALAVRLITEEQGRYDRITKVSDMIAKLGPMFGLLGTLIPLGPGIIALGRGDTTTLSESLLIAFDTTIAGLICAAVALVISSIRKNWYNNYMSVLEMTMECILEVEKKDD